MTRIVLPARVFGVLFAVWMLIGVGRSAVALNPSLDISHHGLRGMPERAALVGGALAVWGKVGVGTEVELRLPAWSVYTIARRRSWIERLRASDTPAHGDQEVP